MRWSLVLVALVVAVLAAWLWFADGARTDTVRGEEPSASEAGAAAHASAELARPASIDAGVAPELGARSHLPDDSLRIFGRVRAADDGPLGDELALQVDVYGRSGASSSALDVPVPADGRFAFAVPNGTPYAMLELRSAELYTPAEVRAVPGVDVELVALRRARADAIPEDLVIAGLVLDQHGQPFEGVSLNVREPSSQSWSHSGGSVTGADGRFELTGLARKRWRVGAQSELAFGDSYRDIDGTRDVFDLVLTLERGGCIRGSVRWPDGREATEFELRAELPYGSKMSNPVDSPFELCGLSPDEDWTIEITARDGAITGTARVPDVRPDGPPLEIVLETTATFDVLLRVHDVQGEPVQDFHASATTPDGQRVSGGGDGEGELKGLTVGDWSFWVMAKGFEDARRTVTLAPGAAPLEFELSAESRIRGRVVDSAGEPVPGAQLLFERRWSDQQVTDSQGAFDLGVPKGETSVRAWHATLGISDALPLRLASGETLDGLVLELREGCRLGGRVLDADGRPLAGVEIHVQPGPTSAMSDESGDFLLEGLAPGATKVFASSESHGSAQSTAELFRGQLTTIELRLSPR